MRKSLVAVLVLIAVTAIALLVRSQPREAGTPVAGGTAPTLLDSVTQDEQPRDDVMPDSPARVITAVARPAQAAQTPPAAPRRPLATDNANNSEPVTEPAGQSAQDGAAILKRASAAYAKVKSMQANFVQRRENPLLNSTLTSRGTLYQKSPDRFALKFSDPAGDIIVGDGQYFWVYYPSADKRQVIRADAGEGGAGAVDLQAQFIGDPVRRFKYTYEGSQKVSGRTAHVLTLVPRQNAGYKSMKVWIDANDSLVRRFQITEQTGAQVEFQLSNLKVNPALGNDIFRFTPPAGAQVIER